MKLLLEHGLRLNSLELGLEARNGLGVGGRVRAAAGVVDVIIVVLNLVALTAPAAFGQTILRNLHAELNDEHVPITLASTFLLDLLRIGVDEAVLGEVAGEMRLRLAVLTSTSVVTIVELVGTGHCRSCRQYSPV